MNGKTQNNFLMGEEHLYKLEEYFKEMFFQSTKIDISQNRRALIRLKNMCEMTKTRLYSSSQVTVELDVLAEGHDFYTSITRERFIEICC
jgi:L1 cell adhesion molecule like protein